MSAVTVTATPPGSVAGRLFGVLRMRYVLTWYPAREAALTQAPARAIPAAQPPPSS